MQSPKNGFVANTSPLSLSTGDTISYARPSKDLHPPPHASKPQILRTTNSTTFFTRHRFITMTHSNQPEIILRPRRKTTHTHRHRNASHPLRQRFFGSPHTRTRRIAVCTIRTILERSLVQNPSGFTIPSNVTPEPPTPDTPEPPINGEYLTSELKPTFSGLLTARLLQTGPLDYIDLQPPPGHDTWPPGVRPDTFTDTPTPISRGQRAFTNLHTRPRRTPVQGCSTIIKEISSFKTPGFTFASSITSDRLTGDEPTPLTTGKILAWVTNRNIPVPEQEHTFPTVPIHCNDSQQAPRNGI